MILIAGGAGISQKAPQAAGEVVGRSFISFAAAPLSTTLPTGARYSLLAQQRPYCA